MYLIQPWVLLKPFRDVYPQLKYVPHTTVGSVKTIQRRLPSIKVCTSLTTMGSVKAIQKSLSSVKYVADMSFAKTLGHSVKVANRYRS